MSTRYFPKTFIIAGIALVISCCTVFIVSVTLDGHWTIDNAVSDLGTSENLGARLVFNLGCIYMGLLYIVFGHGKYLREMRCDRYSGLCAMIAGISIMSIGVLTKDPSTEMIHMIMTAIYAGMSAVAMALSAAGDWREHRVFSYITIGLLLVCGVFALLDNFPVFEIVSISMIGVWVIIQCVRYIRTDRSEFYAANPQ